MDSISKCLQNKFVLKLNSLLGNSDLFQCQVNHVPLKSTINLHTGIYFSDQIITCTVKIHVLKSMITTYMYMCVTI